MSDEAVIKPFQKLINLFSGIEISKVEDLKQSNPVFYETHQVAKFVRTFKQVRKILNSIKGIVTLRKIPDRLISNLHNHLS